MLNRIGYRGAALLFFALVCAVYCYSLADTPLPLTEAWAWADRVAPLPVWAAVWGTAGAVCAVSAFILRDGFGFFAMMLVSSFWGLLALGGFLWGGVERGYLTAAVFLGLAGFVYVIAAGLRPKTLPTKEDRA